MAESATTTGVPGSLGWRGNRTVMIGSLMARIAMPSRSPNAPPLHLPRWLLSGSPKDSAPDGHRMVVARQQHRASESFLMTAVFVVGRDVRFNATITQPLPFSPPSPS
jgi:hypothetical protein